MAKIQDSSGSEVFCPRWGYVFCRCSAAAGWLSTVCGIFNVCVRERDREKAKGKKHITVIYYFVSFSVCRKNTEHLILQWCGRLAGGNRCSMVRVIKQGLCLPWWHSAECPALAPGPVSMTRRWWVLCIQSWKPMLMHFITMLDRALALSEFGFGF